MIKLQEIKLLGSNHILDAVVCSNDKEVRAFLDKRFGYERVFEEREQILNTVCYVTPNKSSKLKNNRVLMVLKSFDLPILVHELVHVVHYFSEFAGVEINFDSQEWQAILTESLFKDCKDKSKYKTIV